MPKIRSSLGLLLATLLVALLLPASVVAGTPVTVEGRLVLAHGELYDDATAPHSHVPGTPDHHSHGQPSGSVWNYRVIADNGAEYRLVFAGGKGPDDFVNGARVRVRGLPSGTALVVGAGTGSTEVMSPVTVAAAVTRKLAVLLVNFTSNTSEPWTVGTAEGRVFTNPNSVASYFAEESDGQLSMTGDVYGYFTIDFDTTKCNYTDLASKAKAAATASGINLAAYTNIQYAFPKVQACAWSGLAYLPGTESWINNALSLRVSSHELGHNFGVHHAATWSCTEGGVRVTLAANRSSCSLSEYGDPFSVMGSASTRHTHNQQLASLGWIPSGQRLTVTTSGVYTLGAAEDAGASVRAIQVPRGDGTYIYLEIRRPTGQYFDNFSASDPAVNGVSIRLSNNWTSIIQSKLLDATPGTTSFSDAPLAVGATFTDPTGFTISTLAVDSVTQAATVEISWDSDGTPPSTPTNLAASLASPSSVKLTWSASSDNRGVAGYAVSRDGTAVGTTTSTTLTDAGLAPGTYTWAVQAFDAAGNTSAPASVTFTVPDADSQPPSAPTNLRVTSLSKSKATVAWNASTDNVGVTAYRVYRDGKLIATVTSLTYAVSRQRTDTTYLVYAVDAAGNVSGASNTVVVPKR